MKACFVISLDFELAWGSPERWLDEEYINRCLLARDAAVDILELLERYDVHATWATVGAMFASDPDHFLEFAPPEELRPSYHDQRNSPYEKTQLITSANNEAFFCPEIIKMIQSSSGQEIASHTFSHYYCLEKGQLDKEFSADLTSFKNISSESGVKCTSIVFPRNQCNRGYLSLLTKCGFTAMRGTEHSWIWKARSRSERTKLVRLLRIADAFIPITRKNTYRELQHIHPQIVDIPSSRFLRPYSRVTRGIEALKSMRIVGEMKMAARDGCLYHLWFHPSNFALNRGKNIAALERVLQQFSALKEEGLMAGKTMAEVACGESPSHRME